MPNFKLAILLYLLPIFCVAQSEEWKLRVNKDGIKVFTRDKGGASSKEFKASTRMRADLEMFEKIMDDHASYPKWQKNVEEVKLIEKKSDSVKYLYFYTDLPWPIDDRDSVFRNLKSWSEDKAVLLYINDNKPDYLAPRQDRIRVQDAEGFWKFTKDGEYVNILYQWRGSPGVKLPDWIINLFIVDGPYDSIINLKSLIEGT